MDVFGFYKVPASGKFDLYRFYEANLYGVFRLLELRDVMCIRSDNSAFSNAGIKVAIAYLNYTQQIKLAPSGKLAFVDRAFCVDLEAVKIEMFNAHVTTFSGVLDFLWNAIFQSVRRFLYAEELLPVDSMLSIERVLADMHSLGKDISGMERATRMFADVDSTMTPTEFRLLLDCSMIGNLATTVLWRKLGYSPGLPMKHVREVLYIDRFRYNRFFLAKCFGIPYYGDKSTSTHSFSAGTSKISD
jgi:hypothetical protein